MKRIVIGTAGHIDHGKSTLVKALTGIDPDRLKEEKRRGITIELGFAHLTLPDGTVAGVVDVPGHERFVKAMAAGAGGIDLVMLVIAADEGVMPQTREHLDICRLLGVPRGVVVINKADLIPSLGAEWIDLVRADLVEITRGTFLEKAKTVLVSAATGEGLPELVKTLGEVAAETPERPIDGPVFLPIDRTFTLKGFGTVVTGTLLSGQVTPEMELSLIPDGVERLRVRGVQVHGKEVPRASAGQRTAVNLPGVEASQIARGMCAVDAGLLSPTSMIDVKIDLLPSALKPLKDHSRLLLHLGTAQAPATIALLDRTELTPGDGAFAQIRLGAPLAALPGQRFILRGFTAIPGRGHTLAGGVVLAIAPRKRRRTSADPTAGLAALEAGDPEGRVAFLLEEARMRGLSAKELFARTALPEKVLNRTLEVMSAKGSALLFDKERRAYVAPSAFEAMAEKSLSVLDDHAAKNPLAPGCPREELRTRAARGADPKLFAKVLQALSERKRVELEGDVVRRAGEKKEIGESASRVRTEVLSLLKEGRLSPPRLEELAQLTGASLSTVQGVLKILEKEGFTVRVSQDLFFDRDAVSALREKLISYLKSKREITTQEFKEMVGATRKYTIPLGEYFDREKVTLRVGEKRVLRGA
jgi:selenocysteine-specific elongation factor